MSSDQLMFDKLLKSILITQVVASDDATSTPCDNLFTDQVVDLLKVMVSSGEAKQKKKEKKENLD